MSERVGRLTRRDFSSFVSRLHLPPLCSLRREARSPCVGRRPRPSPTGSLRRPQMSGVMGSSPGRWCHTARGLTGTWATKMWVTGCLGGVSGAGGRAVGGGRACLFPLTAGRRHVEENTRKMRTSIWVSLECLSRREKREQQKKQQRRFKSFIVGCFDNFIPITFTFDCLQWNNFFDAVFGCHRHLVALHWPCQGSLLFSHKSLRCLQVELSTHASNKPPS